MLICILFFNACSINNRDEVVEPDYKISKNVSNKSLQNIKSYLSANQNKFANFQKSHKNLAKFNFDDITVTTSAQNPNILTLSTNQINYGGSNSENYSIGFYEINGEIAGSFILKIINLPNNKANVEYYNLKGESIISIDINKSDATAKIINKQKKDKAKCNGEAAAACIDRYYTKSGWTSVFLFAASIIAPEIALAIAAGCSLGACS